MPLDLGRPLVEITSEPSLQDIQKVGGVQETVSSENSYNSPLLDHKEREKRIRLEGNKAPQRVLVTLSPAPVVFKQQETDTEANQQCDRTREGDSSECKSPGEETS